MADLEAIRRTFRTRQYQYTLHGAQQRIARFVHEDEIEQAIASGEIIEDYPHDKYEPSCLIFGKTARGRPLHIQVSVPSNEIKVITVYEPNPQEWIDVRQRRPTHG